MEKAYQYIAKNQSGQRLSGVIYASSKPLAYSQLKKGGLLPVTVQWSLGATISGLTNPGFNKQELSRLYTSVGRRLSNGKSMVSGLEAASEYVENPRLRQAVVLMRQALLDGQSEYQAMLAAGFPRRDSLVVRSTVEAGKTAQSFIALGDEIARTELLRKALASTFRIPAIMSVFMALFIWDALMFIAPGTLAFLKQTGLKVNFSPLIATYFDFVRLFHKSAALSSVLYFGTFIAGAKFLRSQLFRSWLDKFKTLRLLSLKSDHATLCNSFCLLYDAAVPAREAAAIVASSATRDDTRRAFMKLAKLVESGRSLEEGTQGAGFPPFIVSGIAAAASSGDMVAGLTDMTKNLEEDVRMLTVSLQDNAKIGSILFMGVGVLVVFTLTYYPMIASVMSNV